ncbi:MAG: hypothetical protein OXQ84_06580 [bacterium]|nr:hypothetical protein [bacterium]
MSAPLEAVARRCFRREEARRWAKAEARRLERALELTIARNDNEAMTALVIWSGLKFVGLWLFFALFLGSGVLGFGSALGTLVLLRVFLPKLRSARRFKAFRAGDPGVVLDVYRFAVDDFLRQVESHRARTLGNESEWAAARESLAEALDGAQRSVAYWRARLGQEPDNQVFARQLKTATELRGKLRSALDKLDGRADVLRKFYNDCEARIAVMDRCNRDIEETRRLDRLSGAADVVIAGAETALAGIGASFVREARKMGRVLGSFERLQLKSLAGEAPLDDIEFLADRVNESSEAEFATVEQLSRTMEELGNPTGR